MKLVFLGTTGYHPNDRRQTACLMIPEAGVVLDAGTAMYRVADYVSTEYLDIFLSHAHLDHVVGLTYLLDVAYGREIERIVIHGQSDQLRAVDEHLFAEPIFPVKLPWEFRPLEKEVPLPGGGRLKGFPLDHPGGGATGFRLDWPGHSMAYVTDTTARPDAPYIEHLRGVDLLVHECYFPDAMQDWAEKTGHSCTTPVAQVARQADVKRLYLVHVNPMIDGDDPIDIEVARAIFPHTELSHDRQVVEF